MNTNELMGMRGDVDLAALIDPSIRYGLRRVFNGVDHFDYVLTTKLPNGMRITIQLNTDIGTKLARYWKQNEYGTFLGQHNMDWIIHTLTYGEEPHVDA